MYKGQETPENLLKKASEDLSNATIGYGVANWYLYNGETRRAFELFDQIIKGKMWPAFGYLAAEAELARLKRSTRLRSTRINESALIPAQANSSTVKPNCRARIATIPRIIPEIRFKLM